MPLHVFSNWYWYSMTVSVIISVVLVVAAAIFTALGLVTGGFVNTD